MCTIVMSVCFGVPLLDSELYCTLGLGVLVHVQLSYGCTVGTACSSMSAYVPIWYCTISSVPLLQAAVCLGRGRRPLAALDYGTRNGLTRQGDQQVVATDCQIPAVKSNCMCAVQSSLFSMHHIPALQLCWMSLCETCIIAFLKNEPLWFPLTVELKMLL